MAKRAGKAPATLVDTTTLYVDLGPENMERLQDIVLDLKEKEKDEKKREKLTPVSHIKGVLIVTATQYYPVWRKLVRDGEIPAQKNMLTGETLKVMTREDYEPLDWQAIPPDGVTRVGLSVDVGPKLLKQLGRAAGLMNTANRVTKTGRTWKTFDDWLKDLVLDDIDARDSAIFGDDLHEEDEEVEAQGAQATGDDEVSGEEADGDGEPDAPSPSASPAAAPGKA